MSSSQWGSLEYEGNPLLRADVLALESTDGDRLSPDCADRQLQLKQMIGRVLPDRGAIMIPAFSLGRTQELLFELEDILHRKALLGDLLVTSGDFTFTWSQLPIILDSP